jgi:hypothetical protein
MSWYQTYDGMGSMGIRSSSSMSTGFSPSMPVSLVHLDVDSGQIEHPVR